MRGRGARRRSGDRPAAALIEVPVLLRRRVRAGPRRRRRVRRLFGRGSDRAAPAATYRVYMVGFVPGFAYMAEVDPRIAAPRRATPRTAVPAGSVAIAGGQTGIYPEVDARRLEHHRPHAAQAVRSARAEPFLFRSGDEVRFLPMTREAFDRSAGLTALHRASAGHADDRAGPRPLGPPGSGVPVAGPMDAYSHRLANRLVGNDDTRPRSRSRCSGPSSRQRRRRCAPSPARSSNVRRRPPRADATRRFDV